MSRKNCHRCLLFYLSLSIILIYGLSQRIPRRSSCPSCSQDRPDVLASPWYARRDMRPEVSRDISVTSLQNSPYFRLIQEGSSQDATRDNIFLVPRHNSLPFKKYPDFPQHTQESQNARIYTGILPSRPSFDKSEQRNVFLKDLSNKFLGSLNNQEISAKEPRKGYSYNRIPSSMQLFDKSGHENLSFRSLRNKHSEFSSKNQNIQDDKDHEKESTNKLLVVYRADRNPSWENLRNTSSNIIPLQKPLTMFRQEDTRGKQGNTINKYFSPISRKYTYDYSRRGDYITELDASEIKNDPYTLYQNLKIQKPIIDRGFYNNRELENSSQTPNVEKLNISENNFLEVYPVEQKKTIISKNNGKEINYNPYMLSQDLNMWGPTQNKESFNDANFAILKDLEEIIDMRQLNSESNWLRRYLSMEKNKLLKNEESKNNEYFTNQENRNHEYEDYVEDKNEKDEIEIEQISFNSDTLPQVFKTRKNEKSFNNLDFMMRADSQNVQRTGPKIMMENNDKYFQDKKNEETNEDKARIDRIFYGLTNNYNPYISSQYSNSFNSVKYPELLRTEGSSKIDGNILHINPIKPKNESIVQKNIVIHDNMRIQNPTLSNDNFDRRKYNSPAFNIGADIKNYAHPEDFTELDPEFMGDIEDPLTEPTEPTASESFIEFSTPKQQ